MHSLMCSMFYVPIIGMVLFSRSVWSETSSLGDCVFHKLTAYHTAIDRLKPLVGKSFPVTDADQKNSYVVSICKKMDTDQSGEAGALQYILNDDQQSKEQVILGRMSKADIMSGEDSNWVYLEYSGGKAYGHHCGQVSRRTVVMITCKENEYQGKLRILEENTNKTGDCYYLFSLEHAAVCPDASTSFLSIGTILLIVLIVVVTFYLLGGFLYQRFIVGAKGLEQIPHFAFWQDFGNLQADGCDLVCRCGTRQQLSGEKAYRGIGDDQLRTVDDHDEDRDEHLLPM